jgi:RNA polymerase sigma-70 factor (ECF subfamily)
VANRELDADLRAKGGASDLAQETFCKALADFSQFAGHTPGELVAWLRRILHNNVANFTRHFRQTDKRQVGLEVALEPAGTGGYDRPMEASSPSPSHVAMGRERAEPLEQALQRLPDQYREVIVLRHREGQSFEAIGRALDRSPDAARKLWVRAIAQLQQELPPPDVI